MNMERKIYPLKTYELHKELMARHFEDIKKAKDMGKRVAWCHAPVPTTILTAFNIVPVYPENHSAMCGAAKVGSELCQVAEAHGYSADICSYARNDLGCLFSGGEKSPVGGLPKPDILFVNAQCQTVLKWFEIMGRHFGVPVLVLEGPVFHDGMTREEVAAATEHVRQQLGEHIAFLEHWTGQRLNWYLLQEHIDLTGKAGKLYRETIEMQKNVPSPITSFDVFLNLGVLMDYRGFPEAVDYYQKLKEEVADRVKQRFSAIGEEVYRLYFDNIPPWYKVGYLARKFVSYGACFVSALYPYSFVDVYAAFDSSRPLESMAESQIKPFTVWGVHHKVDLLTRLLEEFRVDGLVAQVSRTCKVYIEDQIAVTREVQRRMDLPVVTLEGDMVDSRLFDEVGIENRIEAFMEILASRKG
jgi:benzoyl-CoA reductase/2-hydroxyglutaryl-CoA dehydratase subunit BcrC/BadD/HgdB